MPRPPPSFWLFGCPFTFSMTLISASVFTSHLPVYVYTSDSFYLKHIFVYIVYTWTHTCECTLHVQARGQCLVYSPVTCHHFSWERFSYWTQCSPVGKPGWSVSSRGPHVSSDSVLGLQTWMTTLSFLSGCWESTLRSYHLCGRHFANQAIFLAPLFSYKGPSHQMRAHPNLI